MKVNNPTGLNGLNQAQLQQDNLLKKLATGRRINSAADDAAGLQIANQLSSSINAKTQGERNVYDGVSLARVYEQGLQGVNDNLGELSRLAVAAGNGIYGTEERAALQAEADAYVANAQQIIDNTEFAGKKLFGADASVAFGTGSGSISLTTTDVAAGLQSSNAFAIDFSSAAGASAALDNIAQARDFIGDLQTQAGAEANRFASAASNLSGQRVAEAGARSRIEDLDFARATSNKTAADILAQSSTSVAMQARMQQQQALTLLG
ncbi:flagellin [Arsukibacterium ikkense]|uniref:Flagellin n=1 Tax=Arsukibacterium ikkense TaxID=336831 RepID=A0A0M2VD43_9GAMM|nr:flagellin [Arsukibacterium ikkense]KKO47033.1 flagellin [Arsukibacterium ikkense]